MKKTRLINATKLAACLQSQMDEAQVQESQTLQNITQAFGRFEAQRAESEFKLASAWNALRKSIVSVHNAVTAEDSVTLTTDTWFLRDLLRYLTPDADEVPAYVTGPHIAGVSVLSRICGFELADQSPVYARGTPKACADALIEIHEHGNILHAVAHSHPGAGAAATHQSSTDVNYLTKIQDAGSNAIGMIFTRDGHLRFFTVHKRFSVSIVGQGVAQIEEHLFKLD